MSNLNPGGLTRVLNYVKTWVTGLLNGKANSGHTHDDRYYTETEVDTKLNAKANDNAVVHTSGNETITGNKYFNGNYVDVNGYRFRIKGLTQEIGAIPTDRNAWNGFSFVDKNGNSTFTIENGHLVNGNTMLNFSFTRNLTDSTLFNYESVRFIKDEDDAQKLLKCGVYPTDNNKFPIGSSSSKWADVYATTLHGELDGNSSTATTLETSRSLWGNSFNGSQNLSGNIEFTNNDLTGVVVGVKGKIGSNDYWRVGGGATATNAGFLEIASADDSNEPIYVRQYKGAFTTVNRTATLLDANGNTQFPGTVTATTFTGNLTGDCSGTAGSVAWANVSDKPTIPSKTSDLTNDSGFLTSHQSLSNYSTLANTVKSLSISGKTITVTPGSGSAYTLTTQDTVYTHPTTAGNKHVPSGGSSGQFLGWDSAGTAKWVNNPNSDTKNTAGSTDTSSKIFLVGATSQAANPQTYSHDTAYVGTDGCLYSGGTKVLTAHQSLSNYSTLANTIKSLSISGKTITYTKGDGTTGTLTTQDTNTTYSNFVKSGSGAKAGLVPAPSTTAGTTKYLREDGTWQVPPDHTYTVNNATLTIQKNGSNVATFTSNASSNVTANITVPTNTNQLTNGAGFITSSGSCNYANSAGSASSTSSVSFSNNGQCYINAGGADCADAIDSQACNIAIRSWWSIGFYDQCFSKYAISMNTRDGIVRAYTLRAENSSDKGLQLGSYHLYVG